MLLTLKFLMFIAKLTLTWIYLLAILFADFDKKKWWCYVVMVASIVFVWL